LTEFKLFFSLSLSISSIICVFSWVFSHHFHRLYCYCCKIYKQKRVTRTLNVIYIFWWLEIYRDKQEQDDNKLSYVKHKNKIKQKYKYRYKSGLNYIFLVTRLTLIHLYFFFFFRVQITKISSRLIEFAEHIMRNQLNVISHLYRKKYKLKNMFY